MTTCTTNKRYCGRDFSKEEIERIGDLIAAEPKLNRSALSRLVCDLLQWRRPDGREKEMSCRVAMLRMHREGLIGLPPAQTKNGNGRVRPKLTVASHPQFPLQGSLDSLGPITLCPVKKGKDSSLWNELIERYHYLRYTPLAGAQLRYLVFSYDRLLAALGFAAAAWMAAPRDRFIGWTHNQRKQNLHLVVNNARFLIMPWVEVPNLASHLLAKASRALPSDWQKTYHYRPVLLETFVQANRFHATCYKAANWIHVGTTKGRGKLEKTHQQVVPLKHIFLYPLHRHFRETLCSP